eukprot:1144520-Pelagomonas_calceolata.AAC.2
MNAGSSLGFDPSKIPSSNEQKEDEQMTEGSVTQKVFCSLFWRIYSACYCQLVCFHKLGRNKITPLCKKEALPNLKHNRMLVINGCIYRLYANVVHDLQTEWALTEGHIPDTQFGFCPMRNTNLPLFILQHALSTARNRKKILHTVFLSPQAAYDNVQRKR